jgi:hypothetical protein
MDVCKLAARAHRPDLLELRRRVALPADLAATPPQRQPSAELPPATVAPRFDLFFLPWWLRPSRLGGRNSLLLGLTLGFSLSLSLTGLALYARDAWKRSLRKKAEKRVIEIRSDEIVDGVEGLIGAWCLGCGMGGIWV